MKDSIIKNLLVNTRAFFTVNTNRKANASIRRIDRIEAQHAEEMEYIQNIFPIVAYFSCHPDEAKLYEREISALLGYGYYVNFPYPTDTLTNIESGTDGGMPFVVHNGKKLFFPCNMTEEDARSFYNNYVAKEKLLGCSDEYGLPHQYQSPRIKVEECDTLMDIGSAEGLFALDNIERARKVILVESNAEWIPCLKKTFAPFDDRVTIFNKSCGPIDSETEVSLNTLIEHTDTPSVFIKMDIEGAEYPVIAGCSNLRNSKMKLKLAVCTYHLHDDAERLRQLFVHLGLWHEFSTGYMLFKMYDTPRPPYFRHGIIRASNTPPITDR